MHRAVLFNQLSSLTVFLNYLATYCQPNEILDYLERRNNSQPPQTALDLAQNKPDLKFMLEATANMARQQLSNRGLQNTNQELIQTNSRLTSRNQTLEAINSRLDANIQQLTLENINLTQINAELNAERELREAREREETQQINTLRSTLIPTTNLSSSRYRFQPSNQNPDPGEPAPSSSQTFQ